MSDYEIVFEENPSSEDLQILESGIAQHAQSKTGKRIVRQVTFFVRDEKGRIVGGVHGNYANSRWLYVNSLWVSESVRGNGYGTRLMNRIEGEAIKGGCTNSYLDTFSYQAPEFYKKLGYRVFGELENFPPGHSRYFLGKQLPQP
ncbi:MAG: GNAT family N-acetyltransferase [Pyrinomonadaceae bacterium]